MVGPQGLPGEPDLFFENLGGGRFRDATAAAGLTDAAAAYGFGVVATDYDRRRAASICSWPTIPTRTSSTAT
jgi:hypothetical protein